jgi:hypothetical protein
MTWALARFTEPNTGTWVFMSESAEGRIAPLSKSPPQSPWLIATLTDSTRSAGSQSPADSRAAR